MGSSFTFVVGLQLFVVYCAVILLWVRSQGRRTAEPVKSRNIWHCDICAYEYADNGEDLSRCPRCGNINRASTSLERKKETTNTVSQAKDT